MKRAKARASARLAPLGLGFVCVLGTARAAESSPADTSDEASEQGSEAPMQVATTGPELAVRLGYATGAGRVMAGETLRSWVAGALPFWLDAGYRLTPEWFVGGYGQYGLGISSRTSRSECPGCQVSWIRFGLQVQYRVLQGTRHNLWVGLGVGQEFLNVNLSEERRSSSSTSGFELANLQFGSEWQPLPGLGLGPYLSTSFGTFTSRNERCERETECRIAERDVRIDIDPAVVHVWTSLGLRVVALP